MEYTDPSSLSSTFKGSLDSYIMGLQKNIDVIAGLDISNGKATIALVDRKPDDLKQFHRSYQAVEVNADQEGITDLLNLNFSTAILEPTGMHYSKIFADAIERSGRVVRWVDHQIIANYRKAHQLPNKNDQADAIALACYGLEHHNQEQFFLSLQSSRVRELYLQLESLNRIKNPIINRLRQQLAHDYPEASKRMADRDWLSSNPPGLWSFIAGEGARRQKLWQAELERSVGAGISTFSKGLAHLLCELEREEYAIEVELNEAMSDPLFIPYLKVLEQYSITKRTAAALLSQIYPMGKFLLPDGRQNIDHINGSKRNRSLGAFKLSLGIGLVQHQSGNLTTWKAGGSKHCRTALWRWCKTTIIMRQEESTPQLEFLQTYYENCEGKGDQRVMKVVSKAVRMIYSELIQVV